MTDEHPLPGRIYASLPEMRFLTEPAAVEAHRWDATEFRHPGRPLGVAFPRSTQEAARSS